MIDYFVLDSLADDIESLEQILPSVAHSAEFWDISQKPEEFGRDEVIASMLRLIRERDIAALVYDVQRRELVDLGEGVIPDGSLDDYWFRMTTRGRMRHSAWEPPAERSQS
jgi:hypothetical protein